MDAEELNDSYGILCADMFDLANKEELSFWDKQRIKGLEIAFKVFKEYAEIKDIKLLEPGDSPNEKLEEFDKVVLNSEFIEKAKIEEEDDR